MLFLLGIIALAAVVGAVVAVVVLAGRQAKEEQSPESEPTDFVAPSSGGRYTWRQVDESTAEFKARAARERAQGK
ncbi:hypothetical protein LZC95_44535 [Pendulispora brunnea]|uniref:Uncharacterized protein n=1 Tax=Pendulispora brunnea TaxID=2905690 RepID=A0ABZ2K491_9BACT